MNRAMLIFGLCYFISLDAYTQESKKFQADISSSIASGWWIYTLGTGAGIDRTDNEPKLTFEASLIYKPNRLGVGLSVGYSLLFDNFMEAFEDTRARRSKYRIAEKQVELLTYSGLMEYLIYSNEKFSLSPQVKIGGFNISTTHPEKDNFDQQWFWEFGIANEFSINSKWSFVLRPVYQMMAISVKQPLIPGEKHRIFSFGLAGGLRYGF